MIQTMTKVESSNIEAIGYDPIAFTMKVEFKNGSVYAYQNVTPVQYDAILNATSVGSAFNSIVKKYPSLHPFTKEA